MLYRGSLTPLILVLLAAPLAGQETRSMIYGRVLDPQGGVVSGASIVVTNTETNVATQLKCNETGYYEANLLLPGVYEVAAEAPGFKKFVRRGIDLAVSTRLEIGIDLQVGALTETVSVTAEAPMLDTSTVTSGRIMDN